MKNISVEFFATSNQTIFDIKLYKQFDEYICRNSMTFTGFVESYNNLYYTEENETKRPLVRQRLVELWFTQRIKIFFMSNNNKAIKWFDSKKTESIIDANFNTFKEIVLTEWNEIHSKTCKNSLCNKICKLKSILIFLYLLKISKKNSCTRWN
jgi:hypothetical protein